LPVGRHDETFVVAVVVRSLRARPPSANELAAIAGVSSGASGLRRGYWCTLSVAPQHHK
jgi:hypothetical protein